MKQGKAAPYTLFILLLAVLIATCAPAAVPLHAQEATPAPDPDADIDGLSGIEYVGARTWLPEDFGAIDADPPDDATPWTVPPEDGELSTLVVTLMQFETPAHAAEAYPDILGSISAEVPDALDALIVGDQSAGTLTTSPAMTEEDAAFIGVAQQDAVVAILMVTGDPEAHPASAGANLLVEALSGEPGDDVTLNEDGTSTGGIWEMMPEDEGILSDLAPFADTQLFPEPDRSADLDGLEPADESPIATATPEDEEDD